MLSLLNCLPSCITAALWSDRDGRVTERLALAAVVVDGTDAGATAVVVQLAEDLHPECARRVGAPGCAGDWLSIAFERPSPAVAEVVRVGAAAGKPARFEIWWHPDDARVGVVARVDAATLASVRLVPGIAVSTNADEPTELRARVGGKVLAGAGPLGGHGHPHSVSAVEVPWHRPAEPGLERTVARALVTPLTVTADLVFTPFLLGAGCYMLCYQACGGRG